MAINKVVYGNKTLIDVSNVTVSNSTLLKGKTAMNKKGELITGTVEVQNTVCSLRSDIGGTIHWTTFASAKVVNKYQIIEKESNVSVKALKGSLIVIEYEHQSVGGHIVEISGSTNSSVICDDQSHTILLIGSGTPIVTITEHGIDYSFDYPHDFAPTKSRTL